MTSQTVRLHSELRGEAEPVESFPQRHGGVYTVGLGSSPQFLEFENIGRDELPEQLLSLV